MQRFSALALFTLGLSVLTWSKASPAFVEASVWNIHNHTNWPIFVKCSGVSSSNPGKRYELRTNAITLPIRKIWAAESETRPVLFRCFATTSSEIFDIIDINHPQNDAFEVEMRGFHDIDIVLDGPFVVRLR